jgi:hypothetical protein
MISFINLVAVLVAAKAIDGNYGNIGPSRLTA